MRLEIGSWDLAVKELVGHSGYSVGNETGLLLWPVGHWPCETAPAVATDGKIRSPRGQRVASN